MISFEHVSKIYKNKKVATRALDDVSLSLPNSGMIFIVGKSGSGKTTMLNLIGLLDNPSKGNIILNGKKVNKLKKKEVDYYRNIMLGFVFQDYNLIDDLNVYQNIKLALDLQKRKVSNTKIEEFLELTDLSGLGKRKTNELSGGQKQRVAIARALIKNPYIILADEPTGNLDSENSEQIFSILKKISAKKLVIVVSHDEQSAYKYADRVIKLQDGKIAQDVSREFAESYEVIALDKRKSELSLFKAFLLSLYNLKRKKFRLLFTTFILTVSLAIFGIFSLFTKYDINKVHARAIAENDHHTVQIVKKIKGKDYTTINPIISFTTKDIDIISEKLSGYDLYFQKKVIENNSYSSINLSYQGGKEETAYYSIDPGHTYFAEYSQKQLSELKVIGSLPDEPHEILIHKVYADFILYHGVDLRIKYDENEALIIDSYSPDSYEDIIKDRKEIGLGSSYVIISGIIDEDLAKYEELKNIPAPEMAINPTKLYEEYKASQMEYLSEFIVPEGFFETFEVPPNTGLDSNFYREAFEWEGKRFFPMTILSLLNKEVEITDGISTKKITKLNNQEILIDETFLMALYPDEYNSVDVIRKAMKTYQEEVALYEQKLKEQEEQMQNNPDYVYEEITPPVPVDTLALAKEYMLNFFNEKQLLGKKVTLEINDLYLRTQDVKTNRYEVSIAGLVLDDIYIFVSDDVMQSYMREKTDVSYLSLEESDEEKLVQIFEEFPIKGDGFLAKTIYSDTIIDLQKVVDKGEKIMLYCSFGALIFSLCLFCNHLLASIKSNKKQIGVLRALGAKTKDIFKVFYNESLILSVVSLTLASLITYFSVFLINDYIAKDIFFEIKPIFFRAEILLYMIGVVFIVSSLVSLVGLYKLSRQKPVDIIYK